MSQIERELLKSVSDEHIEAIHSAYRKFNERHSHSLHKYTATADTSSILWYGQGHSYKIRDITNKIHYKKTRKESIALEFSEYLNKYIKLFCFTFI